MLFSFTIDPSAIASTANRNIGLSLRKKHTALIRNNWRKYGVLYAISDSDGDGVKDLLENIRNIEDDSIKKIWQHLWQQMQLQNRLKPLKVNGWQGYEEGLQSQIYRNIADEHNLDLVCLSKQPDDRPVSLEYKTEIIGFLFFPSFFSLSINLFIVLSQL